MTARFHLTREDAAATPRAARELRWLLYGEQVCGALARAATTGADDRSDRRALVEMAQASSLCARWLRAELALQRATTEPGRALALSVRTLERLARWLPPEQQRRLLEAALSVQRSRYEAALPALHGRGRRLLAEHVIPEHEMVEVLLKSVRSTQ
jgi:hypothetical protein